MADFSQRTLFLRLRNQVDSGSSSDVVELACGVTGIHHAPIENRAKLLSDNGKALVSK